MPSVSHLLASSPVVLFVDGHGPHISHSLVSTACKEGVIMCLPPHSRHLLQPLDVTHYGPLKTVWKEILKHCIQVANGSYSSDNSGASWVVKDDVGEESAGKTFAKWLQVPWPVPPVQNCSTQYKAQWATMHSQATQH